MCYDKDNIFIQFWGFDAFDIAIHAVAFSIFSMKIPYPLVGSFTITCVTAPTILPFWMIGEPDTSAVNKGQHFLTKNSQKAAESDPTVSLGGNVIQIVFNIILWRGFCQDQAYRVSKRLLWYFFYSQQVHLIRSLKRACRWSWNSFRYHHHKSYKSTWTFALFR